MKRPEKVANTEEAIKENIHRKDKWLKEQTITAKEKLSPKMFDLYEKYNEEMIITGLAASSRHKNLIQFIHIVRDYKIDDLITITEAQVRTIIAQVMNVYGNGGQESWYTQDLKKQLRYMIRFAKTGRGFHIYIEVNAKGKESIHHFRNKKGQGVDILSSGGYVVE